MRGKIENNHLKICIAILLSLLMSFSAKASHIFGGEMSYSCLGNDYYSIKLKYYRDCSGVNLSPTTLIKVANGSGTVLNTYTVSKGPSTFLSVNQPACGQPAPNICIETADYVLDSIYLPGGPSGYIIYNQECCRNNGVSNVANAWRTGATFPAFLYNNTVSCNNSPDFGVYPPIAIPVNVPLNIPLSATDPDGDSLYFDLCAPLSDGNSTFPFSNINFTAGYSSSYMVPSSPAISIDHKTGNITGKVTQLGKFAIGICISEYRNGVLVGKARRDYQFTVISPWSLFATITSQTDASCGSPGSATVTAAGAAGPYTYNWSNGATTATANNLSAGSYSVVVSNGSCTDTAFVTIGGGGAAFTASVVSQDTLHCGASTGASATISISGGQSPYVVSWPDGSGGLSNNNLNVGINKVGITDASGCSDTLLIDITSAPSSLNIVLDSIAPTSCNGVADGFARLTTSGGNSPYSYQWSDSGSGSQRSNLNVGAYTVVVTDANGCKDSLSLNITAGSGMQATWDSIKPLSCAGGADGYLAAAVSGGTSPYTYSWSHGGNTNSASSLPAASYILTITDAKGCSVLLSYDLIAPTPIQLSLSNALDPTCYNSSNGSLSINISGGTTPYHILWSTGDTISTLNNLGGGSYGVTVTDSRGCSLSSTYVLNSPDSLAVALKSAVDVSCNGGSDGAINISIQGGTSPYNVVWNNSSTDSSITSLSPGSYSATVTDANGCSANFSHTISQPTAIAIQVDTVVTASCGLANGSVDISVSGGQSPYSVRWSNGMNGTSIGGLAASTYTALVTDANGCMDSLQVNVNSTSGISAQIDSVLQPACGLANGFASVTVQGGIAPYSYQWSNGSTNDTARGLNAGQYYVIVTDAAGCTDSLSFSLSQLTALSVTLNNLSNPLCYNSNDGSIALNINGGTAPYNILWSTGDTTSTLNNLGGGSYGVTVTDGRGCSFSTSYALTAPDSLAITLKAFQDISCNGGNDGLIQLSVSGGTAPYNVAWSNGIIDSSLTGLSAGSYTASITDANGCAKTISYTLTEPQALQLSQGSVQSASCGQANGSAQIAVSGGSAPYSIVWNNGMSGTSISGLYGGNYTATVTDSNGCRDSIIINVNSISPIAASLDSILAPACGLNNGFASVVVQGGVQPYTFSWSNGSTADTAMGLMAGSHTVIISDASGCTDTLHFNLKNASQLNISLNSLVQPSCFSSNDGSLAINISGGNAPYNILWSTGDTTSTLNNLGGGSYGVTVTDSRGCSSSSSFTLSAPDSLSVSLKSAGNVQCKGAADGFLNIGVSGGSAPYTISWNNGSADSSLSNIPAGVYNALVSDANGCSVSFSYSITEPTLLQLAVDTIISTSCGNSNGAASVSVSGGTAPYSISWSNGATASSVNMLAASTYGVLVTDANGCTDSISVVIGNSSAVTAQIDSVLQPACGLANGFASVTVQGGIAPYSYQWSNGSTNDTARGLNAGQYYVIVTDAAGCTDSLSFSLSQLTALSVTLNNLSNPLCYNSNDGSIALNINGGTAPYNILWSTGDTTSTLNNLGGGSYGVTVTDGRGCSFSTSYTLTAPDSLAITLKVLQDISCNGGNDGLIQLSVSGGTAPYNVAWSNGIIDSSLTGLSAGSYTASITDANGCTKTISYTLTEPQALQLSQGSVQSASCGQANGSAQIAVSGGVAPYSIVWNNGMSGTTVSGLNGGNYTATVTDSNGCSASMIVNIGSISSFTASIDSVVHVQCYGSNSAFARVAVTGGTAPYVYSWSNGSQTNSASGLGDGWVYVLISDASGCTDSLGVMINTPDSLSIQLENIVHAECFGLRGEVEISLSGGVAPYNVQWSNQQSGLTLFNAKAGIYTVSVTDSKGCVKTANYEVMQPDSFAVIIDSIIHPSCHGIAEGSVYLSALGNQQIAKIVTNRGKVGINGLSDLPAGTYNIWVQNTSGCGTSVSFTIEEPEALVVQDINVIKPGCDPSDKGFIELMVNGGTAPYTYLWNDGVSTLNRYNVESGYYTLTVIDSAGCSTQRTFDFNRKKIEFNLSVTPLACGSSADAEMDIEIIGAARPFVLELNGRAAYEGKGELQSGHYVLQLTDAEGCVFIKEFDVDENGERRLFCATAFSPNNDGRNDVYEIKGSEECFTNARLEVFDRWGGKVFETNRPFEEFWDGSVGGQMVKADVYLYNFISDEHTQTGYFTIIH